jgi:hypothetical protein
MLENSSAASAAKRNETSRQTRSEAELFAALAAPARPMLMRVGGQSITKMFRPGDFHPEKAETAKVRD